MIAGRQFRHHAAVGAMGINLTQHHIASFQCLFGIIYRIVGAGRLQHPHQGSVFLQGQFLWILVEITPGSRLDAKGVLPEGDGAQVHLKDLLL